MEINREVISYGLLILNIVLIVYVCLIQLTFLGFLTSAVRFFRRFRLKQRFKDIVTLEQAISLPPVTIIVPAYNESMTIVESLKAFIHMEYPQYEIVVVNDGSKDDTLEVLKQAFDLVPIDQVYSRSIETKDVRQVYHSLTNPDLIVVDKENGGKADAINVGINVSRYPLFCVVDADSLLEEQALMQIVYPFVESPDEVVAVGGIIRIANNSVIQEGRVTEVKLPRGFWARMQVLEYLRAFLVGRTAWSSTNGVLIIAGAFGVFKTSAVKEVGGYLTNTVGEDMELTIRLHRYRYEQKKRWRILFAPEPVCWTQAPEDYTTLRKQRNRWHRGLSESLWRHRRMFMNPKYGVIGTMAMPYFVFIEWLGPMVELAGYIIIPLSYLFGYIDLWLAVLIYSASFLYGQIITLGALLLEENHFRRYSRSRDMLILLCCSLAETFFYRPLNSVWKTIAAFQVRGKKHAWGEMKRKSFHDTPGGGSVSSGM